MICASTPHPPCSPDTATCGSPCTPHSTPVYLNVCRPSRSRPFPSPFTDALYIRKSALYASNSPVRFQIPVSLKFSYSCCTDARHRIAASTTSSLPSTAGLMATSALPATLWLSESSDDITPGRPQLAGPLGRRAL